jgi:hypothetical protein
MTLDKIFYAMVLGFGAAGLLAVGRAGAADATAIDATSFRCITAMTPVRQFYVDNLRGDLAATVAAAKSATGAVYPPGSGIQLITGEAMVKREKGFNVATDHSSVDAPRRHADPQARLRDADRWRQLLACHIAPAPSAPGVRERPRRQSPSRAP